MNLCPSLITGVFLQWKTVRLNWGAVLGIVNFWRSSQGSGCGSDKDADFGTDLPSIPMERDYLMIKVKLVEWREMIHQKVSGAVCGGDELLI